jgi:nitric oxide dioxygenase
MSLQIELLEASFAAVTPKADELVDTFYGLLFTEHPEVRPLFPDDMVRQKKALLGSLALTIQNLRKPGQLADMMQTLARRHVDYGVTREQYPVVGQTLLKALAHTAGSLWTPDLEQAWADAYGTLQGIIYAELDQLERNAA